MQLANDDNRLHKRKWKSGLLLMLVIEKYLGVMGGHEHTQVRAIDALAGSREKVFVTGRDSVPEGFGNQTIFNILSSLRDHIKRPRWAVSHDVEKIINLLVSGCSTKNMPVLFPHAETHDVRVCLSLLGACPKLTRFHMRILREREVKKLTEEERKNLRQAISNGEIALVTETQTMSHLLKERYLLDSKACMLLPCSFFPDDYKTASENSSCTSRRFRVGYLGGFRKEKGSNLVPDILRHLRQHLNAHELDIPIDFVMQKPARRMRSRSLKYDYKLYAGAGWPWSSSKIKLELLELSLNSDEFKEVIRSIDLLLLPYSVSEYSHRGSGIVVDGVMARKPLVYTLGMGMTELLKFGNAEAASEEPADYAAKIIKVLMNFDTYQRQARRASIALEETLDKTASFLKSI